MSGENESPSAISDRSHRLFELIQILRSTTSPITARALAAALEVTARTIYRDIVTLQASGVPIEGAAGIGYVMLCARATICRP
jgi:predicted DNA-binding transcriptional regulator YafY